MSSIDASKEETESEQDVLLKALQLIGKISFKMSISLTDLFLTKFASNRSFTSVPNKGNRSD